MPAEIPPNGPLRIALFAKSKKRTQGPRSIARALERAGNAVKLVNEGKRRRLLGARIASAWTVAGVRRFRPDLVFVHSQDASPETFAALSREFTTVVFTDDCWDSPVLPGKLGLAAHADLFCTVARGQIEEFERAGAKRAVWLPESHDPELHHPIAEAAPEFVSEVAFIGRHADGSHQHVTRRALVLAMAARFDTKLYGRGWESLGLRATRREVQPAQYRQVCRGAGIVLGCDWRRDVAGYFSNRTWLVLGCGGFLLTNYCPGLEDLFGNHRHLVWWRSVDEAVELAEHYRARPKERAKIAAEGHAYVREHRTSDHFARDLVAVVRGGEASFPPR